MPQLEVGLQLAVRRHGDAVLPGGVVDAALEDDRPVSPAGVTSHRTHLDPLRHVRGVRRLGHDWLAAQSRTVAAKRLDHDRLTARPQHNYEHGASAKLRSDDGFHRCAASCVHDSDGDGVVGDKAPHDGVLLDLSYGERDERATKRWQNAEGVSRQEPQTVHRATATGAPPEHPREAPDLALGYRDV
jgi:hypothetical protein